MNNPKCECGRETIRETDSRYWKELGERQKEVLLCLGCLKNKECCICDKGSIPIEPER